MTMDKSHLGEDDKERSNGAPTSGKSEVVKVKEHIVLHEIHLRTMGRHLSMESQSHSVTCHPTEMTAPPSPHPGRLVLDLSTP